MLEYVSVPGDTLLRVAKRFGISSVMLQAANPWLPEGRHLAPGHRLAVPALPKPGWETAQQAQIVEADCEYGPNDMYRHLCQLKLRYPFLETGIIGFSVMGKSIPFVRFGSGPMRIHVNASFHANEWITSLALMMFLEELSQAYAGGAAYRGEDASALSRHVSLWLAPMVNPDGVQLAQEGAWPGHPFREDLLRWNRYSDRFYKWKANIRGVDLNDQFPAHWEAECARRGQEGPGPRDYPGPAPLSEPESRAMFTFTNRHRFDLAIALHTQGQEIYWNYRDYEPQESEALAVRLAKAAGYRPVKLSGSDAGYKDWFIHEFRKPGFTVEAGVGVNPLPLSQFADLYDELAPLLLETMRLSL